MKNLLLNYILIFSGLMLSGQSLSLDPWLVNHYDMRHGLSQMKVSSVFEDSRGFIWVGTRNGLNRFDGQNFVVYTTDDGLASNRILEIDETSDHRLIIFHSKGIDIFNGKSFLHYPHNFPKVEYQKAKHQDKWYFWDHEDVYVFDGQQIDTIQLVENVEELKLLYDDGPLYFSARKSIYILQKDSAFKVNNNFILTSRANVYDGLDRFYFSTPDLHSTIFTMRGNEQIPVLKLINDRIEVIDDSFSGYCIQDKILTRYKDGIQMDSTIIPIIRPFAHLVDKQNNIYIGGDNGLVILRKNIFNHIPYETLPYIWSVVEDLENNLWFSSYGHGLYKWKKGSPEPSLVETPYRIDLFHTGSSKDSQGKIYFPYLNGVLRWDGNYWENIFPYTSFYSLHDSFRDQIVIGINHGIAILKNDKSIQYFKEEDGIHLNYYIQNITIGPLNNYWCGSYNGVSCINPDNGEINNYTYENGKLPGEGGIYCGVVDANGNLWLGGEAGLYYLDSDTKTLKKVDHHLLDFQIKSILAPINGTLLLGGKDGIYRFESNAYLESGKIRLQLYNDHAGYKGIEPGYNGLYQSSDSLIWICSSSSVDAFKFPVEKINQNTLVPFIQKINDQAIRFLPDSGIIVRENEVVLELVAIGNDRRRNVEYNLRIDGGAWQGWSMSDTRILHNMSHGSHKIEVAAGPTYLDDNIPLAKMKMYVDLPFHQRSYFLPFLSGIILTLLLSLGISRWRRKKKEQLYEYQLDESRYLKNQLLLSQMNPHFIFNVLASIQNKIIRGHKEVAIDNLVRLSSMIRNFLSVSYQSNSRKRIENEVPLEKELQLLDSYLQFEQHNHNFIFDYNIKIDDSIPPQTMIPPMLIQPFVENAIKHGIIPAKRKGEIDIKVFYREYHLVIEILDNGIGYKKSLQNKSSYQGKKSMGSTLVKERIQLLNEMGHSISLHIKQCEEGGTKVTIKQLDQDEVKNSHH